MGEIVSSPPFLDRSFSSSSDEIFSTEAVSSGLGLSTSAAERGEEGERFLGSEVSISLLDLTLPPTEDESEACLWDLQP